MGSTGRTMLILAAVLSMPGCRTQDSGKEPPASEPETRVAAREAEPAPVSLLEEVVKSQPPGALLVPGVEETVENRGVDDSGASGPSGPTGESGRDAPPTGEEVVQDLLARATERQACNRVMGCKAGDELILIGADAVGPIMQRYRDMPGWSYQRIHLLELLGRIGGAESVQLLVDQLAAPSWDARAQAAIALGRVGAKDQLEHLRIVLDGVAETDRGFQYALAFSVEKLGGIGGKEILVAGLTGDRVANTNWGYTTVAAAAVGELDVREACPLLVHSLRHRDIFLIKAALASAAALGCRDLAPEVKKLLESPIPSVRREAERTLAALAIQ